VKTETPLPCRAHPAHRAATAGNRLPPAGLAEVHRFADSGQDCCETARLFSVSDYCRPTKGQRTGCTVSVVEVAGRNLVDETRKAGQTWWWQRCRPCAWI